MKRLKILWKIIRVTGFSKFVLSFILYLFFSALLLNWLEPSIRSFGDGLWYSFVSATTLGYGDIVVTTFFGRVLSVILTIYGLIFFGCLSGVLVNYYTEMNHIHREEEKSNLKNEKTDEKNFTDTCNIGIIWNRP
ncbi:MAG TPA: potassium channel family protein [Candidatus Enterococcus stercoripullorum]|nr:potassium channel family protein [Candidatus Enterococcus stercoripullorum]